MDTSENNHLNLLDLPNLLTEQITHLTIDIENKKTQPPSLETLSNIFVDILSSCSRLINLNFCDLYYQCSDLSMNNLLSTRCVYLRV